MLPIHFGTPTWRSRAQNAASTIRTRVMLAFGKRGLSVFCGVGWKLRRMKSPFLSRLRRIGLWVALDLLLASALLGFAAWADTSTRVHQPAVGTCYCGCAMSKSAVGCSKMCDLPKFATRHWAITCAKPRASTPPETPNAQPHLPHRSRAERASN